MPTLDHRMLRIGARLALRGFGRVEPNPMVGCVIADASGEIAAMGHHRALGGAHAEIEALARARELRRDVRAGTMWVTLEPCAHTGRTAPCTDAVIQAGLSRVVAARRDPTPEAGGGLERLAEAGVATDVVPEALAGAVGLPFVKRVRTGLPWVIAKWAQTLDGRIATSSGESKWISGATSRRSVHRLRAMSGAVLTGIGTALADDPLLTARAVPRRRIARRVVLDPSLELALESNLIRTVAEAPLTVATLDASVVQAKRLRDAGVEVVACPADDGTLDVAALLRHLAELEVSTVLIEAGPRTLGRLFDQDLIDEALVYIAPTVMGDQTAHASVDGAPLERLSDARRFSFWRIKRLGGDAALRAVRLREP